LIAELKKAGLRAIAVRPEQDKVTRMSVASAKFEAGLVVFPSWTSWLGVLEDLYELLGFLSTKHDDGVNSLSQALGWTDQEHQRPKMRIRRL
jgi:predicted phage terminase large subunit-like protein